MMVNHDDDDEQICWLMRGSIPIMISGQENLESSGKQYKLHPNVATWAVSNKYYKLQNPFTIIAKNELFSEWVCPGSVTTYQ